MAGVLILRIFSDLFFRSGRRWQLVERGGYRLASCDEVRQQAFINIQVTLVFPNISYVMALGEYTPDVWPQAKRMGQYLENDIPVRFTIAEAAQRSET